jgi:hypothetical protein
MPRAGNIGPAGTVPAGEFEKVCPGCDGAFRTDSPRQVYCSPKCKRKCQNARHYQRHATSIKAQARERRKEEGR